MQSIYTFFTGPWGNIFTIFVTIFGVVVTLFGVVVTIRSATIFVAQRTIKKLSYDFFSARLQGKVEMLYEGKEDESIQLQEKVKVKVLYEEKEVENVHLLTFKFQNNGNQAISSEDYERQISILFNDKATILISEIIKENPVGLGAKQDSEKNIIKLSPLLLNSGDSFSIQALVSNFEGPPKVNGRIKGVRTIEKIESIEKIERKISSSRELRLLTLTASLLSGVSVALFFTEENPFLFEEFERLFEGFERHEPFFTLSFALFFTLIVILISTLIAIARRKIRRQRKNR